MDTIGLVSSIADAALAIDSGRKGFAIIGKEREGRVAYEKGISDALSAFKEAQTTADPQTIILAEYTFISQELQFCEKSDKDSITSLTKAIQSFDDAFLALTVVEDSTAYQGTEKTIPHNSKYRVKGFPKDSFHIACGSHKTRIKRWRTPGIDPIEKAPTNNSTVLSGVDEIRQHVVAQIYAAVWQKLRSRFSGFSGRFKQRLANLPAGQKGYIEKQKKALT